MVRHQISSRFVRSTQDDTWVVIEVVTSTTEISVVVVIGRLRLWLIITKYTTNWLWLRPITTWSNTVKHFNFKRLDIRHFTVLGHSRALNFRKSRLEEFFRKLLKNAQNSGALNFCKICRLANLRENKVLAKIKCYTVLGFDYDPDWLQKYIGCLT